MIYYQVARCSLNPFPTPSFTAGMIIHHELQHFFYRHLKCASPLVPHWIVIQFHFVYYVVPNYIFTLHSSSNVESNFVLRFLSILPGIHCVLILLIRLCRIFFTICLAYILPKYLSWQIKNQIVDIRECLRPKSLLILTIFDLCMY